MDASAAASTLNEALISTDRRISKWMGALVDCLGFLAQAVSSCPLWLVEDKTVSATVQPHLVAAATPPLRDGRHYFFCLCRLIQAHRTTEFAQAALSDTRATKTSHARCALLYVTLYFLSSYFLKFARSAPAYRAHFSAAPRRPRAQ